MRSLRERTEIQQAFLDGAEIEYKYINLLTSQTYKKCVNEPTFNWTEVDFRIKPIPMEIWVNIYPCENLGQAQHSEKDSIKAASADCIRRVKFIEVIE